MLNLKNLTDEQLVTEFKQTRDNAIFGEIYNRYYQKVYHTCLGYTKSRDTAFDLVQDVMVKMMDKLPALEHGHLLGLWIHRVTSNYCADQYKKRKRFQTESIDDRFDMVAEEIDMEAILLKEDLLDGMEQMMEELGEESAAILRLKYLEGKSVKELQSQLNLGPSAVKMRLKRGRSKIAELYNSRPRVAMS